MDTFQELRHLLADQRPLLMPDAYDALSARLIEMAGFKALQCSGYSMALASAALPETGLSFEKNLEITRSIVQAVRIPVMADAEDGFGAPEQVFHTVVGYLGAGVAGMNLEDQILGVPGVKGVIDLTQMLEKISAARQAADQADCPGFVLNARSDALATRADRQAGLQEAIRRANRYLEAGADLVLVTGVSTLEQVKTLVQEIAGPLSITAGLAYNINNFSIAELRDAGVRRVSLPTLAVCATIQAVSRLLESVQRTQRFDELLASQALCSSEDITRILKR